MKIIAESGRASGVRMREAVTGREAYKLDKSNEDNLNMIASLTKSKSVNLIEKVKQLISNQKNLEKQIANFQKQLASDQSGDLISKAEEINGIKLLATEVSGVSAKDLRELADKLKEKLGDECVVVAVVAGEKGSIMSAGMKNLHDN